MKIEPVAYRYRSVSPFKDKDGMCNVSDKWTLIDKPGQRDAHSAMCGSQAESLYSEAQLRQLGEACAAVCAEVITYPPGHGGQFEGYGPVKKTRSGSDCASVIRNLIKELLP